MEGTDTILIVRGERHREGSPASLVLATRRLTGQQVVLVSSGAIAAGIAPLGLTKRPGDLATQQAAASVGQGALVAAYQRAFGAHGLTVGQVLLTADDVIERNVRLPGLVALLFVVGAAILWFADRIGREDRRIADLSFGAALGIGAAQALNGRVRRVAEPLITLGKDGSLSARRSALAWLPEPVIVEKVARRFQSLSSGT